MIILTSTRMDPLHAQAGATLVRYAGDKERMVSVTTDVAHSFASAIGKVTKVGPDLLLKGLQLGDPSSPEAILMKEQAKRFQKAVLNEIRAAHPELKGAFQSFELILSAADAIEALTDPDRNSVIKPALKTSQALCDMVEAVAPMVGLENNPYVKWVSAIVTVGGFAYRVCAEVEPPAIAAPR